MFISTKRLPKLAGLALITLAAACSSDSVSSPVSSPNDVAMNVVAPVAPSVLAKQTVVAPVAEIPADFKGGHSTLAVVYPVGATTYVLTVNPTITQSFSYGPNMITFPAYTICNMAYTSYGSSYWLNSCPKATSTVTIYVTVWTNSDGSLAADFNTPLRFYPNSSGQMPAIYLMDPTAAITSWGRIDYCAVAGAGCINEALYDKTLATQRDPSTGYLFRIIRHFSGYNVWA